MSISNMLGREAKLQTTEGTSLPRIFVDRQQAGQIFRVTTEGPARYLIEIVDPERHIANVFDCGTGALHEQSHISPIIDMGSPLEIRRGKTGIVLDVVQLPKAA